MRVLDEGVFPDTRFVRFSNYCDIGVKTFEDGRFVLISAIDNLVKGLRPSGAEYESLCLGIEETKGSCMSTAISLR